MTVMKTACCHTKHYHHVDNTTLCLYPSCDNYLGHTTTYTDLTALRRISVAGVFVFSVLFTFDDFSKNTVEPGMPLVRNQDIPLNKKTLIAEINSRQILCPEMVFSQIMLESGNLQSFLVHRTNNLLGMRYPVKRKTKAIGLYLPSQDTVITGTQKELRKYASMNNYAVYQNWQDAIADYQLWQESSFKVKERYLEFLGKVYAEDSAYTRKISSIMQHSEIK